MNIIDAIKSGKRFKRKDWETYCSIEPEWFDRDDILADDWEVEEVSCYAGSAMITREDLDRAWKAALTLDELAKELGL